MRGLSQHSVLLSFTTLAIIMFFSGCVSHQLKSNMTMAKVEVILGKPDKIETIHGRIEGNDEHPTVIRWYYSKYTVKKSGKNYGNMGHINFVPIRFTEHDPDKIKSHQIAREYGEQSDSYRTFSYSGSFPTKTEYWHSLGPLDGIPIEELSSGTKRGNTTDS